MFKHLSLAFFLGTFALPLAYADEGENSSSKIESSAQENTNFVANVIRFQTASEDGLFGFVLFRSSREDGPFEKINDRPIAAGGYTDLPQKYEITDLFAVPGQRYFYFIQSIGYDNVRKRFSPVFPVETSAQ